MMSKQCPRPFKKKRNITVHISLPLYPHIAFFFPSTLVTRRPKSKKRLLSLQCFYSPLQLTSKLHNSLKLTSTHHISPSSSLLLRSNNLSESTLVAQTRPRTVTVFAAKGYKMKTHKASAKRFRVTGRGKIVRRRAGKQHLLAKKNTKRKLRLCKMHPVSRSDYDNVIGALPYLKGNRNAK